MKSNRTHHTPAFKAKVALEAIREQDTVSVLAKKYRLHANQIYKWKKQFIAQAALVFDSEMAATGGSTEREDELLKKIGELTMERDFLARGLRRSG